MVVDCSYEEDCSDYIKHCETCLNNKKRSYYRPKTNRDDWYYPYYPYIYPYYINIPSIWDDSGAAGSPSITYTTSSYYREQ